jgi:hypothetical protein
MRERQNGKAQSSKDMDPDQDFEEIKAALAMCRHSAYISAEKPDCFWKRQHDAIMAKLNESKPPESSRPWFVLVPAAAVVLLCLFFFGESGKVPAPDIAGGADQELLIDIDRVLSRECPEAFLPLSIPDSRLTNKADESSVTWH